MKKTAQAFVFFFFIIALLQPRAPLAARTSTIIATASVALFLTSMTLVLTGAYEFGVSVNTVVDTSCPDKYTLVCCSMRLGILTYCQTAQSSCPDKQGPVCLPSRKIDPFTYPLYAEKKPQISTALITTVLGTVGVITAFALYKILPKNRAVSIAPLPLQQVHSIYSMRPFAPPPDYYSTYPSESSLPVYQPAAAANQI